MNPRQLFDRVRQMSPDRPLRTLWRSTGYKLRPPRPVPHQPRETRRQDQVIRDGRARADQGVLILSEIRPGTTPTIVVGGFVPDATEALYLQRGMLLRHGSVYYLNYAPDGFSTALFFAQLEDLIEEIGTTDGAPPVVVGVSFGCGLLLEWMRHMRRLDQPMRVRGFILISPVACTGDIVEPGEVKPSTLLGRALRPFLDDEGRHADQRHVEKCRNLLVRMFESGAKNRRTIRMVMTQGELLHLRHRVITTVSSVTRRGAIERVAALAAMEPPSGYFTQLLAPLCEAPVLILLAERESSMLTGSSPTVATFSSRADTLFSSVQVRTVVNHRGSPVQHASLLFHCFNFAPHLSAFYRRMREHVRMEKTSGRPRDLRSWLFPGRGTPRRQAA